MPKIALTELYALALNMARQVMEQFYGQYEMLAADIRGSHTPESEWVAGALMRKWVRIGGIRGGNLHVMDDVEVLIRLSSTPAHPRLLQPGDPKWEPVAARRVTVDFRIWDRHKRAQHYKFVNRAIEPDLEAHNIWG